MSETVTLRFRHAEDEYAAAVRLYMLRAPSVGLRLAVLVPLVAACVFFLFLLFDAGFLFSLATAAAVVATLSAWLFLALPRQRFRSDPKYRDEYTLEFSDDGIHFTTEAVDARLKWELYNDVLENERFYVLVYGTGMISVIPKRAFRRPADEARFRELLGRHLLPRAPSARRLGQGAGAPEEYTPPEAPPDWR